MGDCYKRKSKKEYKKKLKRPHNGGCGREFGDNKNAMIAAFSKSETMQDKVKFTWLASYMNAGAAAQMSIDDCVLSMSKKPSISSTERIVAR